MAEEQNTKPGAKTQFLNFFRGIFKFRPLEKILVKKSLHQPPTAFWPKLVPPNYLYPPGSRRVANRGGINYELDISDYVEHYIYFGFHDDSHEELFRLASGRSTLIDVGVNIGSVILNFAKNAPDALIVGFEPDSKNFDKAASNLGLNEFANVTLIKKGLGEAAATVKLYRVNSANEGMNRILKDAEAAGAPDAALEEIEIVTLDGFAEENNLTAIDLIKIDVEGYELNVLRGAKRILQTQRAILFVELDDENLKTQGDSAAALVRFLKDLNYRAYRSDNKTPVDTDDDFSGCHFDIVCEKMAN